MMFVGQLPMPVGHGGYAYLFVADDPLAATYDPVGGENALLIQPGGRIPEFIATAPLVTGPTLWRRGATWNDKVPVERSISY